MAPGGAPGSSDGGPARSHPTACFPSAGRNRGLGQGEALQIKLNRRLGRSQLLECSSVPLSPSTCRRTSTDTVLRIGIAHPISEDVRVVAAYTEFNFPPGLSVCSSSLMHPYRVTFGCDRFPYNAGGRQLGHRQGEPGCGGRASAFCQVNPDDEAHLVGSTAQAALPLLRAALSALGLRQATVFISTGLLGEDGEAPELDHTGAGASGAGAVRPP